MNTKHIILDRSTSVMGAAISVNGQKITKPTYSGKRDDVQRFALFELVSVTNTVPATIIWFVQEQENGVWYEIPTCPENASQMADFMGHFCSRISVIVEE